MSKGKKKQPKRTLRFKFDDGTFKDCEIASAYVMHLESGLSELHLEEMDNGKFRLGWSDGLCDEFTSVSDIEIIRED